MTERQEFWGWAAVSMLNPFIVLAFAVAGLGPWEQRGPPLQLEEDEQSIGLAHAPARPAIKDGLYSNV